MSDINITGVPLDFAANMDISAAEREANKLLLLFQKVNAESQKIGGGVSTPGLDVKPLTAYQQAQIEIKKALLEASVASESLRQKQILLNIEYAQGRVSQQTARSEVEKLKTAEQSLTNQYKQGRLTQQQYNEQLLQGRLAQQALNNTLSEGKIAQQKLTAQERESRIERQNLARATKEAQERLKQLGVQIRSVSGGFQSQSPLMLARIREYNTLNAELTEFDRRLGNHHRNIGNYKSGLNGLGNGLASLTAGYLSAGAAITVVGKVISSNAELSDSLADVRRTAQLTEKEADALLNTFKGFDTRTNLKGLLDIAVIAGQLGIAKNDIAGFTRSIDQLSIVLASEIPGGAEAVATALGKINGVFDVQAREGTDIEEAYNRTGSAILGLGQAGLATGAYLQDFTLRVAGVAKAANISLPTVLSYGAVLEEAGSSAEVAGTSVNRLIGSLSSKRDSFFAIAQLSDASLTIEKFTGIINSDANAALQMFFKGLNQGNPSLTDFNDRLDTIGIKAGPSKNAIIALAQNQQNLSEKIKATNKDYLDADKITEQVALKNDNLAGSIDKLNKVLENAANSGSTGRFFKGIVDWVRISLDEFTKLVNSSSWKEVFSRMANNNGNVFELTTNFESNRKRTNDNQQFLYPQGGSQAGTESKLQALGANKFNKYLEALKKTYKQAEEAQKKYQEGVKSGEFKEVGATVQDYRINAQKAKTYYSDILELQKKFGFDKKKEANVQANEDEVTGARTSKVIMEQIRALQNLQTPLDVNSKKYAEYAAQIKKLKVELGTANGSDVLQKKESATLKSRNDLQAEITAIHQNAIKKEKTLDQQEIDAVQVKYDAIRKKINDFYADPKNKDSQYKINASTLVNDQALEKANVLAKQEIDKQKLVIEAQKGLFNEYEQYKSQVGSKAASDRFSEELQGYKTYVDYLNGLMPDETDMSAYANKMRDLLKTMIPDAANDQIKKQERLYSDLLIDLRTYQEKYDGLTDEYENKRKAIADEADKNGPEKTNGMYKLLEESYQRDTDALKASVTEKSDAYQHLTEQVVSYTKQQLQAQLEATEYTLRNSTGLTEKLKTSLQEQFAEIKIRLALGAGDYAFQADLKNKKAEIEEAIKIGVKVDDGANFTYVKLTTEEYQKQILALAKINEAIKTSNAQKFDKLSGDLSLISGAFGDLAGAVGESDAGLKDTIETMGELAQVGSDAAGSVASFMSGDVIGGITKGVKAIVGVINIFKAAKESAKQAAAELQAYQDSSLKGEITYNQLLRERARTMKSIGDLSLSELQTQQAILATQESQAQTDADVLLAKIRASGQQVTNVRTEKYGGFLGIGRKTRTVQDTAGLGGYTYEQLDELYNKGKLTDATKAWFEELKKVRDESDAIAEATKEADDATNQVLTGTTANSIADAIINGFKQGKRSAADFANDFKTLMSDAMYQALSDEYMNDAIAGFYERFAEKSKDGLTDKEIEDLQADYAAIIQEGIEKANNIDKVVGKPNTDSGSSSGGGIKSSGITASQESVDVNNAIARSNYEQLKSLGSTALEHLNVAMMSINELKKIEQHTFNTVVELKASNANLEKIITNTKPKGFHEQKWYSRDGGMGI